MKKLPFIVSLLLCLQGFSQDYFSIQTDFFDGLSDRTWKVIPIEEGIITMNSHLCLDDLGNPLNDCSSYVLYDYSGNVIAKKLIPFIDVQYHSLLFDEENEEVVISGYSGNNTNIFHLFKCSLDGDSLFHQTYEVAEAEGWEVYPGGLQKYQDQYILIGAGKYGESNIEDIHATLLWINMDGSLDTTMIFDKYRYNMTKGVIDQNNYLTVVYVTLDTVNIFGWDKRVGFMKFNEEKEVVWEWQSPFWYDDAIVPVFDITENNEMVFLFQPDPEVFDHESAVGMLSEDGEMLWQYEFITGPYKSMTIFELTIAENGDILGAGTMRDRTDEPVGQEMLYLTGFAFRMSPTGELLWMRRFRDFSEEGELKWGNIHTIAEAEDGSLILAGKQYLDLFQNPSDIDAWLIITDENGCIEPDCEELIILDSRELFFADSEIQLIQNPVGHQLNLMIDLDQQQPLNYQIFNSLGQGATSGRIASSNGIKAIDVTNLSEGMYFLYLYSKEKRKTIKFVKK